MIDTILKTIIESAGFSDLVLLMCIFGVAWWGREERKERRAAQDNVLKNSLSMIESQNAMTNALNLLTARLEK